jgi:hypothetical protein
MKGSRIRIFSPFKHRFLFLTKRSYTTAFRASRMVNEDEVTLLEEPYPWSNLKQKSKSSSRILGLTIALAFSTFGFLLGVFIGPYLPGRLDALCLAKTSIPCESKPREGQ